MTNKKFSTLLKGESILPVVVINNESQALGLAEALKKGGINAIEITLRNSYGATAIEKVKKAYPDMLTIAGTVNSVDDMSRVIDAGVDAIVTPGVTQALLAEAKSRQVTLLPGVATPSEILQVMQFGFNECKLFPATVVGGISALKAYSGPFHNVSFCPTGGVGSGNYQDFLALDNVMCVGGSWIAPEKLIEAEDWPAISALCEAATSAR